MLLTHGLGCFKTFGFRHPADDHSSEAGELRFGRSSLQKGRAPPLLVEAPPSPHTHTIHMVNATVLPLWQHCQSLLLLHSLPHMSVCWSRSSGQKGGGGFPTCVSMWGTPPSHMSCCSCPLLLPLLLGGFSTYPGSNSQGVCLQECTSPPPPTHGYPTALLLLCGFC